MGNFKIEIEAVGGHGEHREVKQGEPLTFADLHERSPDRIAFECVVTLAAAGCDVKVAELTHWPSSTPIVDDLKSGTRALGSFQEDFANSVGAEPVLRFFVEEYTASGPKPLARMYTQFAYALVRRLPRSPERTLALRELLASYDNAKRAMP